MNPGTPRASFLNCSGSTMAKSHVMLGGFSHISCWVAILVAAIAAVEADTAAERLRQVRVLYYSFTAL